MIAPADNTLNPLAPASTPAPAAAPAMSSLSDDLLPAALDGLLFVHTQPLSFPRLGDLLAISPEAAEALARARKDDLDNDPRTGLQVIINEQGVQLATKAGIARFIQRLEGQKLVSLSLPALETLSVIAYKQPITKTEIEAIRGVNCDGVVATLFEKKLVYVSGEKQVLGRPRLYSTTQDFLYYFGLKSLKELPPSIEDLTMPPPAAPAPADSPTIPGEPGAVTPAPAPSAETIKTTEPAPAPEKKE